MATSRAPRTITKTVQQIIDDLQADDEVIVSDAIKRSRTKGKLVVVPYLIDLVINDNQDESVRREAQKTLNELKLQGGIEPILDKAESKISNENKAKLIGSIWNSGLEATDYFTRLVQLAINNDFQVGFECLTIIENMDNLPGDDKLSAALVDLKNKLGSKNLDNGHAAILDQLHQVMLDMVI